MRTLALVALLVGCGPVVTSVDAARGDGAVAERDAHHVNPHLMVVRAFQRDGALTSISIDGAAAANDEAFTDEEGPHEVRIFTASGAVAPIEVRVFCRGVGVESGPGLPPPYVSMTVTTASETFTWECL